MIQARDFSFLRGNLVGISDRMLDQHIELYENYVKQLNAIEATYPMTSWLPSGTTQDVGSLLHTHVAALDLEPTGVLAQAFDQVSMEPIQKGLSFAPHFKLGDAAPGVIPTGIMFYLGDGDFWTTDRGTSINVPWYLANPTLWRLANRQQATQYTLDDVLRCLRHELGHAVGYAYELWKRPDWGEVFGDFNLPYRDVFPSDPKSEDFVEYLTDVSAHYGQKHPDEDWAETFACWLDPESDWRARYAPWPTALRKLEYVEGLARAGVFAGPPPNLYPGRPTSYKTLKGTVGHYLGTAEGTQPFSGLPGWSEHAELLRREPHVYSAVVLHELYFGALGRALVVDPQAGAPVPGEPLYEALVATWGSVESYMLDLRAICGAVGPGWAVTAWDPRRDQLRNFMVQGHDQGVPPDCQIILAIDCWEHSYAADYGTRKDVYLGAVFQNIDWRIVAGRMPGLLVEVPAGAPMVAEIADASPNEQFVTEDADKKMADRGTTASDEKVTHSLQPFGETVDVVDLEALIPASLRDV